MAIERTLLELLKIESQTGNEQHIVSAIKKELSDLKTYEKYTYDLCLCYKTPYNPSLQTLAFYGHTDTVKNQQDEAPYQTDEYIYGCGASDMKSGLAVMIELMKITDNQKELPYNLQFIFYDKEEGAFEENGLQVLLKNVNWLKQTNVAFVLEPTNNNIQMGCVGSLNIKATVYGKSAHSARPWQGENAIHKSWQFVRKLSNWKNNCVEIEQLKFYETMNATLVEGGNNKNSLADSIIFNINYRFSPQKSIDEAKDDVRNYLEELAHLEFADASPSGKILNMPPLIDKICQKFSLQKEPKQAWTDVARLALYNIAAVNFGPGDPAEAHQKNENVCIKNLHNNLSYYKDILLL